MAHHKERVDAQIRKLAAEFLGRVSAGPGLITVTGSEMSDAGTHLKILLSVFPSEHEKKALEFANRKRGEFKEYLKEKIQMRSLPHITFEADRGEKARQHFEKVLREEKDKKAL